MAVCEPYRLWAIEGDESVRKVLSFYSADEGVVITPDITKFKELKLRMLNATHTLSCGLAYLSGFKTVKSAMEDPLFESFIENLMMDEISPAIPYTISEAEKYIGAEIRIPANDLLPPKEGWFYTFQLKGCRVFAVNGEYIGTITDVLDLGGDHVSRSHEFLGSPEKPYAGWSARRHHVARM